MFVCEVCYCITAYACNASWKSIVSVGSLHWSSDHFSVHSTVCSTMFDRGVQTNSFLWYLSDSLFLVMVWLFCFFGLENLTTSYHTYYSCMATWLKWLFSKCNIDLFWSEKSVKIWKYIVSLLWDIPGRQYVSFALFRATFETIPSYNPYLGPECVW